MTTSAATEAITFKWIARGFTDDVTECGHCGRVDLKGTVRMEAMSAENESDGETYMGVVCAARMTGRKASEIRTEASRADRARSAAARAAWSAWSDAETSWICAMRDAAVGAGARYAAISAYLDSAEFKTARAAYVAANPEPARSW